MSPALNGSSVLRRFERSNAIEICDGITFDFYMGLPHLSRTLIISHKALPSSWSWQTQRVSLAGEKGRRGEGGEGGRRERERGEGGREGRGRRERERERGEGGEKGEGERRGGEGGEREEGRRKREWDVNTLSYLCDLCPV